MVEVGVEKAAATVALEMALSMFIDRQLPLKARTTPHPFTSSCQHLSSTLLHHPRTPNNPLATTRERAVSGQTLPLSRTTRRLRQHRSRLCLSAFRLVE